MELKIAFFIIVAGVSNVLANPGYSQVAKVSLDMENKSLEQVMDEIERQSEFYFIFNQKQIDVNRIVDIQVENELITDILPELFKGTDVNYAVLDRKILLTTDPLENNLQGITLGAESQQVTVKGTVTDLSTGEALPGVNVAIQGTTLGAITDANGNYSLNLPNASVTLRFSFIGYVTQTIALGGQTTLNVALTSTVSNLDEVVVVGYGTQTRKSLTGSVSTINADALTVGTAPSVITRLQGRASGVSIIASHAPGADATIRIRGMGTINDSDPLWVVDGMPGGAVSSNDIESISILKDAASQAIYGARAANGVVLVTTKTGKRNQAPQININVRQGITRNSNYYDLLNTKEYGELLWLEAKNSGIANYKHPQYGSGSTPVIPNYIWPTGSATADLSLYDNKMIHEDGDDTYLIMEANKVGTEWLQEADRNAKYKEYNIDLSGGGANTTYAFQIGYLKEDGILKWTGYNLYNFRSNITTNPLKWIEIGEKVGIAFSDKDGYQVDNSETSIVSQCYLIQPIVPVYDVMGNYAGTRAPNTGTYHNPIFLLDSNKDNYVKRMTVSGNVYVKLNIFKELSIRSLIGINYYGENERNITFNEVAYNQRGFYDSLTENGRFGLQWTWTNTIEYSKLFAKAHDLKVILGTEAVNNNSNYFNGSRTEFFSKNIDYIQLATGLQGINNDGSGSSWSLFSLFGRFNYTLSNKYMLEGVVRHDGSSRFGGTNKYGIFPAFSVGWRISNENFMASTSSWLDNLKLRAGYGIVGNDRMGNYNSYTNFSLHYNNTFYPITGANATTGATGFYRSSIGNEDVKWETTKTANVGIDAMVFKKLNFSLDVWQRITSDMLYPKQIPMVLGRATAPSVNVGEMKNKGFDIELGYSNTTLNSEFRYNIDFILSHYKNEIIKLSDKEGEFLSGSSYREMIYTRSQSGSAFPEFYGYVVEGIFQTEAEVAAAPPAFGATGTYNKPGHYKYKDINNDKVIDSKDRTFIGSPHPDFTAGLNIDLSYKGFTLTSQLYASYGNKLVNYVRRYTDFVQFQGGRSHARLYESWGSPYLNGDNSKATLPMAEVDDIASQQPSSAFIEDASYLRMKILRLSYDLNSILKGKFRNLQVYGQVSNLFTITKYSGLDPEVAGVGTNMGIDAGAWPTPQQFLFGISFGI